ncbi:MAG: diguanylate cyclase [Kordiimonadaceae bacterium]|jgi:diguanylate cyclase (GGDEF)-like protein|nr:diguanylate cyclase [Kordiimonadaceae bacterium]MBT6032091.1 diguanylate cyclase [Kordiimonadaceae bacterium]
MKYILSVEDSKLFSSIIQKNIETHIEDSIVITAYTMADAQKILELNKYDFDIAVLDINLPDAPNGEIIDLVVGYKVPIFVFSSMMEEKLHKKVFSKPVVDFVLKDNTTSISNLVNMLNRFIKNATTKILYVDDSKTAQRFISNLLSRYNFDVMKASSGEEALVTLESNQDISLVITDFMMPEMDGIGLTKEIRRTYPDWNISIIGMSAKENDKLSGRFLKSGGNDFLNKNFQREEFFCRIHQNINLVEHINELHDIASNDFLTGLPNRRSFFNNGETLQENAVRQELGIVVAMMDIDFFKRINDTWGHNAGDKVLKAVAQGLSKRCRVSDILARVGGEEFAFIGLDINPEQAIKALNEFRLAVEETVVLEGNDEINPTISIGFVSMDYTENFDEELDTLIQRADEALYLAKENGRNRVEKYSATI